MKRQSLLTRIATLFLAMAILLTIAACASYPRRTLRLTGTEFRPRPPDYPIALTEDDYKTPYVALAVITTRAYQDEVVDVAGRQDLEQMARELGGDAVVRISRNALVVEDLAYRPGEVLRIGTRFEGKSSLSGVVVRFRREEASE